MIRRLLSLGLAAATLSAAACTNDNQAEGNKAQTPAAQKAAGTRKASWVLKNSCHAARAGHTPSSMHHPGKTATA